MSLFIMKLLIISILSFQNAFSEENAIVINTLSGKIKGFYKYSPNNQIYRVFKSIPYAKPPVGDLRFEAPVPFEAWSGELDATKATNKACPQFNMLTHEVKGDEDCLYLNVYSPHTGEGSLLPVIFWIPGGGFQQGSFNDDGEKYYMDKNLVYVSVNYRVGPFGFLSTGDELLPGNYGLKDQNAALKWIVDNIKSFGGDPKKITLTGCSSGGVSVHYHYLSPLSRGLFQSGISMSGNALNAWAFAKNPMDDTKKIANFVNCSRTDSKKLVDCLKKLSVKELTAAASKLLASEYLSWEVVRAPFLPVAENIKDGYFINRSPKEIIESGDVYDVPWIVGTDTEEGIAYVQGLLLNQTRLTYVDENWDKIGPYQLFLRDEVPEEKRAVEIAKLARKHYMGNKPLKIDDYYTLKQLIHLTGDRGFALGAQKSVVLQSKVTKSPIYLYNYNYRAAHSFADFWMRSDKVNFGVCHCDEQLLIHEALKSGVTTEPRDMPMSNKIMDMIHSLATKGEANLGVQWPRINSTNLPSIPYLQINGPNNIHLTITDNYAQSKFWNSLGL